MKKNTLTFFIFLISVSFAYKPTIRLPELYSFREMGMGLAYTAIANDEMLLFANPAGIGIKKKLFQVQKIDSIFYFLPTQFEYSANLFKTLTSDFSSLGSYFTESDETKKVYGLGTNSPSDFSYVGNFWAISFISKASINVVSAPPTDFSAERIFINVLKVGFNIYSFSTISREDLHIGIATKFLYLAQVNSYYRNNSTTKTLTAEILSSNRNLQNFVAEILNLYDGFVIGMDLGILWEIHFGDTEHQLNLGISLADIPSYAFSMNLTSEILMTFFYEKECARVNNNSATLDICKYDKNNSFNTENTFIIPNGKVGMAYLFPNYLGKFFSDTILSFDIHHIGDSYFDFSKMYHAGISTSLLNVKDKRTNYSYRINLSAGVNKGGFTFGYLIHLNVFLIAYNYFQDKVLYSDHTVSKHAFKFAFYF